MRTVICAAASLAMLHEGDARACVYPPTPAHMLDPAYGADTVPPSQPDVTYSVQRREIDEGSSCDGSFGDILLTVTASDDAAPSSRLGYILAVVAGGDLPEYLQLPSAEGGVIASPYGTLGLSFDPADEVFDFDLEVRVVDLNGNISESAVVRVADDSSGLCAAGSGGTKASWALVMAAALFASRPRRSRARLRQWQTPRSS